MIEDEATEKSRLVGLENCIMTPHSAFLSEDSFYEGRERCLRHLVQRLSWQEKPEDLVNPAVFF